MKVYTSESSPLRVDFVAGHLLGLTLAPGKHDPSALNDFRWERDLDADVATLREQYEVDCLITLLEDHELELLQIPELRTVVRKAGITSHAYPIADGSVPTDLGGFIALIRTIRSELHAGDRVVVHCRGGLGRAGTVAACTLIALDEPPEDAITAVRNARPGAIENSAQEDFVRQFQASWHAASHP